MNAQKLAAAIDQLINARLQTKIDNAPIGVVLLAQDTLLKVLKELEVK